MNTPSAELELVLCHLQRALELARFFQERAEILERIDLLKRGTAKVKSEIAEGKR